MSTVLIVDDEIDIQSALSFALKDEGYDVLTASSPAEAEKILAQTPVDIGLFDVWFPEGDGMDLLKTARAKFPRSILIMMSGHGNIELALNAIRLGAYDFLEKPLELEKVLVVLRNAAEAQSLRFENSRLLDQLMGGGGLIGSSPEITSLGSELRRASLANAPVMITGEIGSGKELAARLLHQLSARQDKPFVRVNCAGLPEGSLEKELFGAERGPSEPRVIGRFEQAGAGTLFLDEVAELPLSAQAKLLRVLDERHYERVGGSQVLRTDARIVAATSHDLAAEVKAGRFREDLLLRLKVLSIEIPTLRERKDDIAALAKHFIVLQARENGCPLPQLSDELVEWMKSYEWPGNAREMRNLLERMLIMARGQETLGLADLPEELQTPGTDAAAVAGALTQLPGEMSGSLRDLRARFERLVLDQRLAKLGGNVTKTAESLGIERAHLHRKMKQYGIRGEGA